MQLPTVFSYKSVIKLLCLIYLFFLLPLASPVFSAPSIQQLQSQIQLIDQKILSTQSDISACNNALKKLSQDSIATITNHQTNTLKNKTPLTDIEKEIVALSQKISQLNKEIYEAKQDSTQTAHKLDSQKVLYTRESTKLQQLISAASSSIKSMTEQRNQYIKTASLTSNDALIKLNAENAQIDLLLSKYHNELSNLKIRVEKLKQDSINLTTQLQNNQALASIELKKHDSLIAIINRQVQIASNQLSQAKAKRNGFFDSNNQILQKYTSQRAKIISSTGLISANLTKAQSEHNRIRTSLSAVISKYESGKAPLLKKVREIDSILHIRQNQKSLWALMDEKWSLDSAISAKRNELDKIIQQAAQKRKNAMKLTEEKEAELNVLLGKLDQYLEKPGIKQATSQLGSLTPVQKKARIAEIRSNIEKDIARQTSLRQQASQNLADYEKNNPATNNPSIQKLQQLAQSITDLQAQKETLNKQKDSLDALIASHSQSMSQSDAGFQKEIRTLDSILSLHSQKSISLSSQRNNAQQNYSLIQKRDQDSLNKIVIELKNIEKRNAVINREITASNNRKEQLKLEITNLTQSFEQQKLQAGEAAQNLIGHIAKKEQELALFTNQLQQLTTQHNQAIQQYQSSLNTLKNTIQSLNSQLFTVSAQQQNLKKQQSDLNSQLYTSEQNLSRKISEINAAIITSKQKLQTLQSELEKLNAQKAGLIETLNAEKERQKKEAAAQSYSYKNSHTTYQYSNPPVKTVSVENPQPVQAQKTQTLISDHSKSVQQYDSLIRLREQELARLRAERDKTLQENLTQQKKSTNAAQSPPPATVKAAQPPAGANQHQVMSQKIIEQIYTLLGEEKKSDAYRLFTSNKKFLEATAPMEAIRILEASFEGMHTGSSNSNGW